MREGIEPQLEKIIQYPWGGSAPNASIVFTTKLKNEHIIILNDVLNKLHLTNSSKVMRELRLLHGAAVRFRPLKYDNV